jgi:hypothetical protein
MSCENCASNETMSLADSARLGPYEIQSALGAGGMGEVYKFHLPS